MTPAILTDFAALPQLLIQLDHFKSLPTHSIHSPSRSVNDSEWSCYRILSVLTYVEIDVGQSWHLNCVCRS